MTRNGIGKKLDFGELVTSKFWIGFVDRHKFLQTKLYDEVAKAWTSLEEINDCYTAHTNFVIMIVKINCLGLEAL